MKKSNYPYLQMTWSYTKETPKTLPKMIRNHKPFQHSTRI
jgi:hypothetical protein